MWNKSVFKDFTKYVSLNILGQMAYSCYTLADTFLVSAKLGTNGLTALNLAFPIFCILNGIGLMIGMGGGTKYAISKSRGEDGSANRIFTNAVFLVVGFSILFVLLGVFFSERIMRMLGANDVVFSMSNTYLKVMLLFAPAFLSNSLLQCFVRNDGKPLLAMYAMIVGSLSNVVLDYIFIFPLNMGIFGAIFATGLAPVFSIIVLTPYLIGGKNGFHITRTALNEKSIGEILSIGVPPFLTEATSGVVMFLFNFMILRIAGNVGVAAFGIISVISLVVVAVYTGLSQGIQPIISRNYGTQNTRTVKAILKFSVITILVLSASMYAVIYFGADRITSVFNSEGDKVLQIYAETGLKLYFTACPFVGLNIVFSTYFISIEKTFPAQTISLLRGFIILIPMAFLLSAMLQMTGVWCAYPLTESIVALIGILLFAKTYHKTSGEEKIDIFKIKFL